MNPYPERRAAMVVQEETRHGRAIAQSLGGFAFLVASGHFIVEGARGIAVTFGIPEFVIGATVVAEPALPLAWRR